MDKKNEKEEKSIFESEFDDEYSEIKPKRKLQSLFTN